MDKKIIARDRELEIEFVLIRVRKSFVDWNGCLVLKERGSRGSLTGFFFPIGPVKPPPSGSGLSDRFDR